MAHSSGERPSLSAEFTFARASSKQRAASRGIQLTRPTTIPRKLRRLNGLGPSSQTQACQLPKGAVGWPLRSWLNAALKGVLPDSGLQMIVLGSSHQGSLAKLVLGNCPPPARKSNVSSLSPWISCNSLCYP